MLLMLQIDVVLSIGCKHVTKVFSCRSPLFVFIVTTVVFYKNGELLQRLGYEDLFVLKNVPELYGIVCGS